MSDVDPTTDELRLSQLRRERALREQVDESPADDPGTEQTEARADKAAYLREKLEERAEAERQADTED